MERELINHRTLLHPNIIKFREVRAQAACAVVRGKSLTQLLVADVSCTGGQVFLTPTHLAIAMEYAAGGELFDRIVKAGRFSEDEARFFFQQLISGVQYCHSQVSSARKDTLMDWSLLDMISSGILSIIHIIPSSIIHVLVHHTQCTMRLQGVCHRDLKLENTLLDHHPAPRLKICDFGYSKVTTSPLLALETSGIGIALFRRGALYGLA